MGLGPADKQNELRRSGRSRPSAGGAPDFSPPCQGWVGEKFHLSSVGAATRGRAPEARQILAHPAKGGLQIKDIRAPEERYSAVLSYNVAAQFERNSSQMSHSYSQILVHGIFSTKGRKNLIPENMQNRLWAYMTATAKKDSVRVIAICGISNHAHIFFALPATLTVAKAMMDLKANSSRWMNEQGVRFSWQKGYGAFSVSASQVDAVKKYIKNQKEHHRKRNFEEEFIVFLKKYHVDYDPKYVFG